MSRLANFSPAALRAMFSPDADDTLLCLITITGRGISAPLRLVDNYTHRFEYASSGTMSVKHLETGATSTYTYLSTDRLIRDAINADRDNVFYGVLSASVPFLFLPFELTLPTEEPSAAPRCKITLHDVTRQLTPIIRTLSSAPTVDIDLALTATPDVIEASFPGFLLGGIGYNAETVTAELTVESYVAEPFPCDTITPSCFPGLF